MDHLRQKDNDSFQRKGISPDFDGYIAYIITNDELMALLIEDKLIKKHMPSCNIRQKHYKKYKYLGITTGLFPGIKVYGHSHQIKKKLVFGPFRSKLHLEMLITLIQRYYKLRICRDASPVSKCVYHDIELCKGPCTGKVLPISYTAVVNEVIQFLNGNVHEILKALHRDLSSRITGFDFENAEKIQKMIEFCHEYKRKQLYYNLFRYKILEVYNKVSGEVIYGFTQGRICYFANKAEALMTELGIPEPVHHPFSDLSVLLDRSDIIFNWLHRHSDEYEFHFR